MHNGIIENHLQLRQSLEANGRTFETETDTECVMHLVDAGLSNGLTPADAVRQALVQLRGAFAFVFLFRDDPETLIAARNSAPISIGQSDSETFIASDPAALARTRRWCGISATATSPSPEEGQSRLPIRRGVR